MTAHPRVLLFDLYAGGHHLQHFEQHAAFWAQHDLPGELLFAVPTTFLEKFPTLELSAAQHPRIQIIPIEETLRINLSESGLKQLVRNDLEHGRILRTLIPKLRPDHVMMMFFDHTQVSLATDLRFAFPVTFSGIYFRPSFHYSALTSHRVSWQEQIRDLRKRLLLYAALRNPHFRYLFCLDPYAPAFIQAERYNARAIALPDGIPYHHPTRSREEVRQEWAAAPSDVVGLFFGVVDERKGIFAMLESLHHLPHPLQQRLVLVIAGKTPPEQQKAVIEALHKAQTQTPVRFIRIDRFVNDEEIQPMFRAADVALVPYQQHIGSSGVLIRAAAEATPVLASDYGVVGEHVRRHRLGLAVNTTDPVALAQALAHLIANPQAPPFETDTARRFAEENTADAYGRVIYETLGLFSPTS